METRAQVSMEFILVFAILVIFVTAFLLTIYFNMSQGRVKNEQEIADDMANFLQQELIVASRVESGYNRTFFLPARASGKDYTVSVNGNYLVVNTSRVISMRGVPETNFDANSHQHPFLYNSNNTIFKNDSGIYLNLGAVYP